MHTTLSPVPLSTAQTLAAEHADVIAALRATMQARGVQLPRSHFADPDVELARYAVTVGLLTANTPEEKCACCPGGRFFPRKPSEKFALRRNAILGPQIRIYLASCWLPAGATAGLRTG